MKLHECGCTDRQILVRTPAVCGNCRRSWRFMAGSTFMWPTVSSPGESITFGGICTHCDGEIEWYGRVLG